MGLTPAQSPTAPLRDALARCFHAIDKTKAEGLGCAQLQFTGPVLMVASTDGSRLAFCSHSCALPRAQSPFLLPHRALERLLAELQTDEASVDVAFGDDRLFVRVGERALSFVYGSGNFPNYKAVFPASMVAGAIVPAPALLEALNGALKGYLHLRGSHLLVEVGGRETRLPSPTDGQQISVWVNPVFVQEALRSCGAPMIRLGIAGTAAPIVIQPAEPNGFIGVIMPLRPAK